jgi:prepilin-type N-terminal cleavage/methylation domain-containing protein
MTSGTEASGPRAAFTLVEVLVVIAILATLIAMVSGAAIQCLERSRVLATEAQIQRLMAHLEDYRDLAGEFPPDGIDGEVRNAEGEPILGSACLGYFLARPIRVRELVGGSEELKEYPPIVTPWRRDDLGPEERPGVREVVDAWKNPLHYDNTEDGEFRPQGGEVHSPEVEDDMHPDDPRGGSFIAGGQNAVDRPGIQGRGFDLWSHGRQEGKEPEHFPLASWNTR